MQHPYLKTELSRIFLEDLYKGSRRAAFFAKKADVSEFLSVWLDKYGSQEEIQKLYILHGFHAPTCRKNVYGRGWR